MDTTREQALRERARRYHSSASEMIQLDKQLDVPLLDHWRDRTDGQSL